MSVPVAFYEAAAQVIPVLLLTEGVRAGLLLRDVRDARLIEDENDAANKVLTELENELVDLEAEKAAMVLEAAVTPLPDSQREHLKQILAKSDSVIAKAKEQRKLRNEQDANARRIASNARVLETRTVAFVGLTVALEAAGVLIALLVIADPDMRGYWTFGLVYGALCLGVAGVMEQLFHPLAIDKPKGRAQVWVNRALRWLICVPIVALPVGYALVVL